MSRGIHLKRLTSSDLGLLGLPEPEPDPGEPGPDPQGAPERDRAPSPGCARAETAPPADYAPPQTLRPCAAPPPNPTRLLEQGSDASRAGQGDDWDGPAEPDLSALARELRLGLEDTLKLLGQGKGPHPPAQPDESPGFDEGR
jgi:hypothetical protein